jgi:twitching motility protein PilT
MTLEEMLREAVSLKASDVHFVVGLPPTMRINGNLEVMQHGILSSETAREIIYGCLSDTHIRRFEQEKELNVSFSIKGVAYFRMNVYYRIGGWIEAAIRIISMKIPSLQELGLPPLVAELTKRPNGLILITGSAGMGKSTTMTSMIDLINRDRRRSRIIMIEDPVEYIHSPINSVIIQREVGVNTKSFSEGLRQALRQDPNLICIGEMRDLETISIALTAAETGHLVLATLHSSDVVGAFYRIIDIYPKGQQEAVKFQLSCVLKGVIVQRLLPRADNKGRALAVEILITNPAIQNILRSGDIKQIDSVISTGSQEGMIGLDKSLLNLYKQGIIDYETVIANVKDAKSFRLLANRS